MSTHVSLFYHAYIKLLVIAYIKLLVISYGHIEEKVGAFSKLYIWSDGHASQFRSRFTFSFLSHFHLEKEIEWHFNETYHGKRSMDGRGGTIKNKVFREVKSGRLTITSPEESSNAAERLVSKRASIYFPITEMIEEPSYVKDAPKITHTLKIHKVVRKISKDAIPLSTSRS